LTDVVLKDASIIIDLIKVNLLEKTLTLPYNFYTTDFIVSEINYKKQNVLLQAYIKKGSIKIIEAAIEDLEKIAKIFNTIGKLSFADSSIIYFAEKLTAIILTGDYRISKEAENRNIKAHGILWIFKKLLKKNIITKKIAARKLEKLMVINTYLPKIECEKLINEWKG